MLSRYEVATARRVLAREWGAQSAGKLDDRLSFDLVNMLLSEAVPGARRCVILHLLPAREQGSESVGPQKRDRYETMQQLEEWSHWSQAPLLDHLLELTSRKPSRRIATSFSRTVSASERAELIDEAVHRCPAIRRRISLTNTIVADLTSAEIQSLAARRDVELIESDKPALPELNISSRSIGSQAIRNLYGFDGSGVVVAVIGSEVDAAHPDLAGRVVLKRSYDAPFGTPGRHETLVAGIIAGNGTMSGGTHAGVAPGATIWSYKTSLTLDHPGHDKAQAILDAAADGAQIINCSWRVEETQRNGSCLWCKAVDTASALGALVVKSCGNKGHGNGNEGTTTCPANARQVISVGATSEHGSRMALSMGLDFSSRGPTFDGRSKPELVAPGENINGPLSGGAYASDVYGDGTSFAAPHVAGVAALLLQAAPDLSIQEVKEALVRSARKILINGAELGMNTQGAGFLDAEKALATVQGRLGSEPAAWQPKLGVDPVIVPLKAEVGIDDPPPELALYLGNLRHYAVEIAAERRLFDLDQRHPDKISLNDAPGEEGPNFYASWQAAPPLLSSEGPDARYVIPESAWQALKHHRRLFLRAIASESPSAWVNPRYSNPDGTAQDAASLQVVDQGRPDRLLPRIVAVDVSPRFYLFPDSPGFFAVELAVGPELFDLEASHPDKRVYGLDSGGAATFFATWTTAPPLLHKDSVPAVFEPDVNIWEALGRPDRLFYRLLTSNLPNAWSDTLYSHIGHLSSGCNQQ